MFDPATAAPNARQITGPFAQERGCGGGAPAETVTNLHAAEPSHFQRSREIAEHTVSIFAKLCIA